MKLRVALLSVLLAACHREQLVFENAPVILISIDTLRADHLPAYGYTKVETPSIDALRRDSILYRNAYSHCPMTLPSHVSILTGLEPKDHGVRDNAGFHFDGTKNTTIPTVLHGRGYATGAAVSSFVLRGETGLAPLFDSYDDAIDVRPGAAFREYQRPGNVTEAIAERWIDAHSGAPFFYFFHIYEPHVPYEPPEPFRSRYASAYDGEIATADAIVGKLLDHLRAKGIYDRAIIVLCSDHGEGLNDHGEDQHSILVYREAIHVPLLVKLPSSQRANTSVDAPAALSDIYATILRLTGAKPDAEPTLLALPQTRRIKSESLYARYHFGWSELQSVIDDRYHLIASTTRSELYDVKQDSAERHDLAASDRRAAADYRALLDFKRDIPQPAAVDAETKAKLAALGYIGESRGAMAGPLPDPNQAIATLEPMRKAMELASSNHVEEAVTLFRSILARSPQMVEVWTQLGDALARSGRIEDAIAAYRDAIAHAQVASPDLILPLGSLYLQAGKLDDAQHAGELTLTASPRRAQELLARVALARHDLATAARYVQNMSDDPQSYLLSAEIATARGEYEAALHLVDNAQRTAAERESGPIYRLEFVRADALARLGRAEESRAAYEREIASFPNELLAYANLAVLRFLTGDQRGAEATLQSMVRANPTPAARALAARTRETLR